MKTGPKPRPLIDRLFEKVEFTDDCWIWTGNRDKRGYGRIGCDGDWRKITLVHRASYELIVGPVPEGTELDHVCRNTSCVNPDHLEPVSHQENCRRGARWQR